MWFVESVTELSLSIYKDINSLPFLYWIVTNVIWHNNKSMLHKFQNFTNNKICHKTNYHYNWSLSFLCSSCPTDNEQHITTDKDQWLCHMNFRKLKRGCNIMHVSKLVSTFPWYQGTKMTFFFFSEINI